MCGYVKFRIRNYDDGTGELYVEVASKGFSGTSHACFDLANLAEKSENFSQYPLPADEDVYIRGGYWTEDAKNIREEHLYLSAYQVNLRGEVGLLVRLTEPCDDNLEGKFRRSISVVLRVTYAQIAMFSNQIAALIRGDISEIQIDEIED